MTHSPNDLEYDQLLEIAYLALDERMFDDAGAIFQCLAASHTDKPYARIGLALRDYALGDQDEAIRRLHEVLDDFPEAVFTRSMLAQFMKASGHVGWERYARETLARVQIGVAADIACRLLGDEATMQSPVRSAATSAVMPVGMHRA